MSYEESRTKTRTIRGSTNIQKILPDDATLFVEVIDRPATILLPILEGDIDGKILRIRRVAGNKKIILVSDKPLISTTKCKRKKCNCKKNKKVVSLEVDDILTLQYSSECDAWFTMN